MNIPIAIFPFIGCYLTHNCEIYQSCLLVNLSFHCLKRRFIRSHRPLWYLNSTLSHRMAKDQYLYYAMMHSCNVAIGLTDEFHDRPLESRRSRDNKVVPDIIQLTVTDMSLIRENSIVQELFQELIHNLASGKTV